MGCVGVAWAPLGVSPGSCFAGRFIVYASGTPDVPFLGPIVPLLGHELSYLECGYPLEDEVVDGRRYIGAHAAHSRARAR